MGAIFLSASIPVVGRGQYYETADPFLIQCAVREMAIATVRRHKIVWGGHPAITPMIWSICEDLGVEYTESVVLYQSRFFEGRYPEENQLFDNVVYTDSVPGDIQASLQLMREEMLSREDLIGAVFIGGMDGVEVEFEIFKRFNPQAFILPVAAPGGAALNLARDKGYFDGPELDDIDFATLFNRNLPV
ncbi:MULTISPECIES: SLOG domain-containing protein [Pseudomonas fluorescens group]